MLLLLPLLPCPVVSEPPWPYNLPAHVKYFPEDEAHVRRALAVQQQLAAQAPAGVRKMSDDEGEMFFLDYWQFDEQRPGDRTLTSNTPAVADDIRRRLTSADEAAAYANASTSMPIFPSFPLHADQQQSLRFLRRSSIQQRAFQCPSGTNSCTAINRPNSCCATGETCMIVRDTGLGDVGCCPQGTACGGQVSACNTANGYSSCPSSLNGGCCIPNYVCQDVGCESRTIPLSMEMPN